MVGIGRHHELALAKAKQIVLAHDAGNTLMVDRPAATAQLFGNPPPSIGGPFQRDLLDGIAQIHVRVWPGVGVLVEAIIAGPAYPGQLYHPLDR